MTKKKPLTRPPRGKTWRSTTAEEAMAGSGQLPKAWLEANYEPLATEADELVTSGGAEAALERARGGRGRPPRGQESGPTMPRSVRFSAEVWKRLEEKAAAEGLSLHAALRVAVLEWAARDGRKTG